MPGLLSDAYLNAIKGFEGYTEKPTWDYRQWSSGYGTRASGPNDIQPRPVLEQRFSDEIAKAAALVDARFPTLPEGARAALTSLTYNAGPSWMNGGLGKAVGANDWTTARNLFQQYTQAGGKKLQGLVNRRAQEGAWLVGVDPGITSPASALAPMSANSMAAQATPAGVPFFSQQQQPNQQASPGQALTSLGLGMMSPQVQPMQLAPIQYLPIQQLLQQAFNKGQG